MEAVLAAHAAAVAAEAVHVGEVGVRRGYPPRPRVERVLLVDVVVISFPGGGGGGGGERSEGGIMSARSIFLIERDFISSLLCLHLSWSGNVLISSSECGSLTATSSQTVSNYRKALDVLCYW